MTEDELANLEIDAVARAEFHLHVLACLCAAVEMEKVEHADCERTGTFHEMTDDNVVHRAISLAIAVEEMIPQFKRGAQNQ